MPVLTWERAIAACCSLISIWASRWSIASWSAKKASSDTPSPDSSTITCLFRCRRPVIVNIIPKHYNVSIHFFHSFILKFVHSLIRPSIHSSIYKSVCFFVYSLFTRFKVHLQSNTLTELVYTRNSSGDEIANVNFRYDDIEHAIQNTTDSCKIPPQIDAVIVLVHRFTKFSEITQCNGHYAGKGHTRSQILVPIESSYTTSY